MYLNNEQLIAVHRNLLINTFKAYSCHFSLILLWDISRQSTRDAWCHQPLDQVSDRVDFALLLVGYNERLVTIYLSNVRDIFVTRVMYVEQLQNKYTVVLLYRPPDCRFALCHRVYLHTYSQATLIVHYPSY